MLYTSRNLKNRRSTGYNVKKQTHKVIINVYAITFVLLHIVARRIELNAC